jgi:hypothetical protein
MAKRRPALVLVCLVFVALSLVSSFHKRDITTTKVSSDVAYVKRYCNHSYAELSDILIMVSTSPRSHVDALWRAWGRNLGPTGSLEFFTLNPHVPGKQDPKIAPTNFPGVMEVQFRGTETGILKSMSYKTKRAFETCLERHPDRKWFIKTDDDTLVVIDELRHLLGRFNHSEPWYMGYVSPAGTWADISYNSGSFYILSRKAVEMIQPVLRANKTTLDNSPPYEDVMMGRFCLQAGINPHSLGQLVYWSGPEFRAAANASQRYLPFVAVHNIKNDAALIEMGGAVDAFVPHSHTYSCIYNQTKSTT